MKNFAWFDGKYLLVNFFEYWEEDKNGKQAIYAWATFLAITVDMPTRYREQVALVGKSKINSLTPSRTRAITLNIRTVMANDSCPATWVDYRCWLP